MCWKASSVFSFLISSSTCFIKPGFCTRAHSRSRRLLGEKGAGAYNVRLVFELKVGAHIANHFPHDCSPSVELLLDAPRLLLVAPILLLLIILILFPLLFTCGLCRTRGVTIEFLDDVCLLKELTHLPMSLVAASSRINLGESAELCTYAIVTLAKLLQFLDKNRCGLPNHTTQFINFSAPCGDYIHLLVCPKERQFRHRSRSQLLS